MRKLLFFLFVIFNSVLSGQTTDYRIYFKAELDGRIRSRLVTLDSLDVMHLKEGELIYQLLQGKKVISEKKLNRGGIDELKKIASSSNNYYVDQMLDILTNEDEPATVEEAYPFMIFLSHYSFNAAKWLGLGIEDRVTPNNQYIIRYSLTRKGKRNTLTEKVINVEDWGIKPFQPDRPILRCGNHTIEMELNAKNCKRQYFGFKGQRRKSGSTAWIDFSDFITINPYYEKVYGDARFIYQFNDSIPENDVIYEYRTIGMDYFGEFGTPGLSDSCECYEPISSGAYLYYKEMVSDSSVSIQWTLDSSQLNKVRSFELWYNTDSLEGIYKKYPAELDLNKWVVVADLPATVTNYHFKTIPFHGPAATSYNFSVERLDHIPPAIPTGLEGTIDTFGVVRLKWKENKEKDLWGYKIFFGNDTTDQFSLLTSTILLEPKVADTIRLDNLTQHIYYKVLSIDMRGNYSEFSKAIMIEKPDTIPPMPAFIRAIKQFKDNNPIVLLKAIGSGSTDIRKHELFRSELGTNIWVKIWTLGKMASDTIIVDTTSVFDKSYEYKLVAFDKSNNKRWSEIKTIDVFFDGMRQVVIEPYGEKDTTLHVLRIYWKKNKIKDCTVEIFRTNDLGNVTLLATSPAIDEFYADRGYNSNRKLDYKLRVVYPDGTYSKLTNIPVAIKKRKDL